MSRTTEFYKEMKRIERRRVRKKRNRLVIREIRDSLFPPTISLDEELWHGLRPYMFFDEYDYWEPA